MNDQWKRVISEGSKINHSPPKVILRRQQTERNDCMLGSNSLFIRGCHRTSFTGLLTFHLVQILKEFVIINPDALASRHAKSSPKLLIEISVETIKIFVNSRSAKHSETIWKLLLCSKNEYFLKAFSLGFDVTDRSFDNQPQRPSEKMSRV